MPLDRSHLLAAVLGLSIGGVVYRFLITDWYFALAIAALYAGVVYFYSAFDISLLGTHLEFEYGPDKLGYAVGLFGVSLSPLALGHYAAIGPPAIFGIAVWVAGVVAFLISATTAATQRP